MFREFEVCGITYEEFHERLNYIKNEISPVIASDIEGRDHLDVSTILIVLNRARIVERLIKNPGFDRVKKSISQSKDPRPSLYEPHGEWFQLVVGDMLTSFGEDVSFEQMITGSSHHKDIVIRNEAVVIECKSFVESTKTKNCFLAALNGERLSEINPSTPKEFNQRRGIFPTFPWVSGERDRHGIAWVTTNDYPRFYSAAIADKYHQMVQEKCNIIAVNVSKITDDIFIVRSSIAELLKENNYNRISGVILMKSEGISGEDYKMKGVLRYRMSLIENPIAEIQIPAEIVNYFSWQG